MLSVSGNSSHLLAVLAHGIKLDCEDALTNWVESRAQVRSRLSQRGSRQRRTGGRASRVRHNLADQDRPLQDERGWVPANEHERKSNTVALNRDDEDDYEDITDDENVGRSNQNRHTGNSSRRTFEGDNLAGSSRGRRETEGLANEE